MRRAAPAALLLAAACATAPAPPEPVQPSPPAPGAPSAAPAATPTPAPTPMPTPAPPPRAPLPPAVTAVAAGERPVRVLLLRSDEPVHLPEPGRPYLADTGGETAWLWGPLEIAAEGAPAWQIGAFADSSSADAAETRLRERFGAAVAVDRARAADGLERVRVRWREAAPVDPARELAAAGFPGAFATSSAAGVRVRDVYGSVLDCAGPVRLEPWGDHPTPADGKAYRGSYTVRAAGGQVLLVNELPLETYLRGVVPAEMGPVAFPELEALKAQAVAARTYALAHLGDHEDEGWDLCDTPACQVYEGVGVEHRLTDRAVAETAGLILTFAGEPIDAMYTSTCGGHTEDAGELFGPRPYLQGVACAWERPLELAGAWPERDWVDERPFRREVALRALDLEAPAASPAAVLARVAELCDGRAPAAAPADGDGWSRALLAAAGLEDAAAVLLSAGVEQPAAALADLLRVPLAPRPADWYAGWYLEAALAVLEMQGVVVADAGEAVPRPGGPGIYPRRAERSETLPQPLPLYERWGDVLRRRSRLEVLPGAHLERWRRGDEVLALAVRSSEGAGLADRRSAWSWWVREVPWSELGKRLGVGQLERLEITERAPTGRAVGLLAVGRDGTRRTWDGFAVRRALDLPETWFAHHVLRRPDGTRVVRFLGRGWGHGVGLCQNGAYGLARAGRDHAAILATYYTGAELTRVP